jgi:hypothetical protein
MVKKRKMCYILFEARPLQFPAQVGDAEAENAERKKGRKDRS